MAHIVYKNHFRALYSFISQHSGLFLLLLATLGIFIINKVLFFLILFITLDFLVSTIDLWYKIDCLFDFNPIGLIIFCYSISFDYAFIFAGLMLVPRIINAKLEKRHLIKVPILIIIGLLASLLNSIPIAVLGGILFTIRYLLEYAMDFAMTGTIDTSRIIRRIGHLAAAIFFFTTFGGLFVSLLK